MANYWRWSFFSLAKSFTKLLKLKIWQTKFSKLLEMLERGQCDKQGPNFTMMIKNKNRLNIGNHKK
jgi:hypothetical protein